MRSYLPLCLATSLLAGCMSPAPVTEAVPASQSPTLQFYTPFGAPTRPFTPAVRVGDLVFLSGQIGTRPDAQGGVVPGGIQPETRQTMENIRVVLQSIGLTMEHVAKCTVFLADMAEWPAMNEVYVTFFPNNRPARSALGANGLALNARVEIECMASMKK